MTKKTVRAKTTSPSRSKMSLAHVRIADACRSLEAALADFENDEEAQRRARAEAEKLTALRRHLEKIRRQLDELSI